MVKSQFIEMFGSETSKKKWNECVDILNGKAYKEDYQNIGTYPICGSGGVMGYGEKKLCSSNTIILGRKGNINSPIYMDKDYWIVDTAFSLSVNQEILLPKYFYFWCKQFDFTRFNKQGVLPSLTKKDLLNIEMEIPPIEMQKEFVNIYNQADKSKFGGFKSQFIEMFGNPIANDKKWKTSPLKEVAPESCSNHTLITNVWLLNLDMIESNSGNVIKKIRQDYSTMLSVSAFDEGNVLFSKLRPYLNKVVIPDESGYATTELVPLRPNTEKLNKYFLGFLLRSDSFVRWANKIATGTKMPRMPLKELRNFMCILPPIALQNQFVLFTEQADKSKFELKKCIENIDNVIKSLINEQ